MNKMFAIAFGAAMLASGASYATDAPNDPYASSQQMSPAMVPMAHAARMADVGGRRPTEHHNRWTVKLVDPAQSAYRKGPDANRDTDRGSIRRELAANPGLSSKLKSMRVSLRDVAAISIHGGHRATVFLRS